MELSGITVDGNLVERAVWETHIDKLKERTKLSAKEELKDAIVDAVKKRIPKEKFGVLFSGGVDSSLIALICRQQKADFICYTVGFEKSNDLAFAEKIAEEYGFALKKIVLDLGNFKRILENVVNLVGPNVMKAGVGSVVYAAAEMAKKDKINIVFTGLGAEDIFAGYHKFLAAKNINEECWKGLKTAYERDFLRDCPIAKNLGVKALVPFLDPEVIVTAMGVPGSEKIKDGHKKFILREIAEELGLKHEFAFRAKQAAQFGSKTQKAILVLKKQSNVSGNAEDYLKTLINKG
jgi:asparagine synthase (glutamine-hydrolysing)